jgi:hypothetical protein
MQQRFGGWTLAAGRLGAAAVLFVCLDRCYRHVPPSPSKYAKSSKQMT